MHKFLFVFAVTFLNLGFTSEEIIDYPDQVPEYDYTIGIGAVETLNADVILEPTSNEAQTLINQFNIVEIPATITFENQKPVALAQGSYCESFTAKEVRDDIYGDENMLGLFIGKFDTFEKARNTSLMLEYMGKPNSVTSRRGFFTIVLHTSDSFTELMSESDKYEFPFYINNFIIT